MRWWYTVEYRDEDNQTYGYEYVKARTSAQARLKAHDVPSGHAVYVWSGKVPALSPTDLHQLPPALFAREPKTRRVITMDVETLEWALSQLHQLQTRDVREAVDSEYLGRMHAYDDVVRIMTKQLRQSCTSAESPAASARQSVPDDLSLARAMAQARVLGWLVSVHIENVPVDQVGVWFDKGRQLIKSRWDVNTSGLVRFNSQVNEVTPDGFRSMVEGTSVQALADLFYPSPEES